jgi:hypothetical protein
MVNNKIEVFRIVPIEGKYYKTTTYTEVKDNKYWSTNKLRYVGKYVRHILRFHNEKSSYRNNAEHYAIFDNNGIEIMVQYTPEKTTCFVEIEPNFK